MEQTTIDLDQLRYNIIRARELIGEPYDFLLNRYDYKTDSYSCQFKDEEDLEKVDELYFLLTSVDIASTFIFKALESLEAKATEEN